VNVQCDKLGTLPSLHASASLNQAGRLNLSIANLDPEKTLETVCEIRGIDFTKAQAQILASSAINAHNTFEKPGQIAPRAHECSINQGRVSLKLPPHSVCVIELKS